MAVIGNLRVDLGLNSAAFDQGLNKAKSKTEGFAKHAGVAFAAVAAAAAAASVAFGRMADEWSDLNSRLSNATGSIANGAAAMNRLQQVARSSYSSIAQTTEAYIAQATTLNALGVSTNKQLDLTETLNNALVISATRGDKARSVMENWSKAMALGSLRGENLNSVIANSPRLAQALADSMGVSVTALRQMGEQGKITRAEMLNVTSQLERLREEADEMPATIADGMGILQDAVFQLVGRVDQATGASAGFATQLIAVGDAITSSTGMIVSIASSISNMLGPAIAGLAPVVGIATAALAGFYAPAVLAGLATVSVAIGTTMVGAVKALTLALLANPLGLFIGAIGAAVAAAFIFRDEIRDIFGVDLVEIAKDGVNGIIGAFDLGLRNIQSIWGSLPNVLGDIAITTANNVISAIEDMVNGAVELINGVIRTANNIPGLNIGEMGPVSFGEFGNPYAGSTDQLGLEMALNKHIVQNTDYVGQFSAAITEMVANADAATASLSALNVELGGGGEKGMSGGLQAANDNLEKFSRALSLVSALETPFEKMAADLASLDEALAAGVISWQQYAAAAINSMASAAQATASAVGQQLGMLSQAFEGNKALAYATAVVKGIESIVSSYAAGARIGGPVVGAAFAATAAAATAGQIAAIGSTSMNSKSMPSARGVANAPTPPQAPGDQRVMNITLAGTSYSRDQVRELIEAMNEEMGDGVQMRVNGAAA